MAGRVTVCCKAPNGLELQVMPLVTAEDLITAPDGKTKLIPDHLRVSLGTIYLRGTAKPIGVDIGDPVPVVGGYAINSDIDADLWEAWLAQNQNAPMVVNRMVFAEARQDTARAKSKEQAELRSNLEPMRERDARMPKGPPGLKIERGTATA